MPDYFDAPDGFRIAYDVVGIDHPTRPPVVLLHGMSNDKRMWGNYGILSELGRDCTLITIDLRGCGDSQASPYPADYGLNVHIDDVLGIVDELGYDQAALWGWSLGGTLALHMAAHTNRFGPVIVAGATFGQQFNALWRDQQRATWEPIAAAKAEHRLHELSDLARPFAARTDFAEFFARLDGYATWPAVEPADLQAPTILYTGTADGRVFSDLSARADEIRAAGHQLYILSNFNHVQLVMQTEIVLPTIRTFLGIG